MSSHQYDGSVRAVLLQLFEPFIFDALEWGFVYKREAEYDCVGSVVSHDSAV